MRVIKVTQALAWILAVALAVLILADWINIWILLAITIVHGCNEAISTPPRVSIVNALVPQEDLSAAIALNSAQFNASRVVGPAIGGGLLLASAAGMSFAFGYGVFTMFPIAMAGLGGVLALAARRPDPH